mgnify:CR=1 FL=1
MRGYIGLILGLTLAFGASESRGQLCGDWTMQVQTPQTVVRYRVADVDSITFTKGCPSGMICIPAGNVRLGQAGVPNAPEQDFYVEAFCIGRYEVTNTEFKAFIDANGYTTQAYWNPIGWIWKGNISLPATWDSNAYHGGGIAGNGSFPVIGISWWEADAYCRWAGGRLPTEAEWEKAAKGGCETHGSPTSCESPADTPAYPWGNAPLVASRANYTGSGDPYETNGHTTPVGYYNGSTYGSFVTINSPSPYGLYDVAGNVWEWCSSEHLPGTLYDPNDGREDPPPPPTTAAGSWAAAPGTPTPAGCAAPPAGATTRPIAAVRSASVSCPSPTP